MHTSDKNMSGAVDRVFCIWEKENKNSCLPAEGAGISGTCGGRITQYKKQIPNDSGCRTGRRERQDGKFIPRV